MALWWGTWHPKLRKGQVTSSFVGTCWWGVGIGWCWCIVHVWCFTDMTTTTNTDAPVHSSLFSLFALLKTVKKNCWKLFLVTSMIPRFSMFSIDQMPVHWHWWKTGIGSGSMLCTTRWICWSTQRSWRNEGRRGCTKVRRGAGRGSWVVVVCSIVLMIFCFFRFFSCCCFGGVFFSCDFRKRKSTQRCV